MMNTVLAPVDAGQFKDRIMQFLRQVSLEVTTHDEERLPQIIPQLPQGATVYVAHTPKATLDDVVRVAVRVQAMGFRASPHITARRMPNVGVFRATLRALRDGGVEQLLMIAGDRDQPVGKFESSGELLETGATVEAGIKRIGVAGHPEGHKAIGPTNLWSALAAKQSFAERTGTQVHIVTQFGFNPDAVGAWQRHLVENGIHLPIHVGMAGPAPLPTLIKFAMQCGIGTSLRAVVRNMSAMSNVARVATSVDEMLVGVVRVMLEQPATRIVQPHFFCFGGSIVTARWVKAVARGAFDLDADNTRLTVHPQQ